MAYYDGNEKYSGVADSYVGAGASAGVLYTDRRKFYLNEYEMAGLYPNVAPFLSFTTENGTVNLPDPDFKLFVDDDNYVNQQFAVNTTISTNWSSPSVGDTATFNTDGYKALAPGENLKGLEIEIWDSTGSTRKGVGLITDYSSTGDAVTVKFLGNAGSTGGALADNDVCYVIGNAQGEGTRSPKGWSSQPSTVWNSAQIEKTVMEITGTLYEMALRGSKVNELVRLQQNKMKEHLLQRERKMLFGERAGGTSAPTGHTVDANGNLVRTTAGMIPLFEQYGKTSGDDQNVFDVAVASYDYDQFVDDTQKIFQYIPSAGLMTAQTGGNALSFWNKLGANGFIGNIGATVQIGERGSGVIGYNYKVLETPHGMIRLVWNPLLRGIYAGHMLINDSETVKRGVYRTPQFQTAIQENDYDGQKDQYFSDEGLVVTDLRKNFLMKVA